MLWQNQDKMSSNFIGKQEEAPGWVSAAFCCTKKNNVLSYREVPTQQQKIKYSEEIHTFS